MLQSGKTLPKGEKRRPENDDEDDPLLDDPDSPAGHMSPAEFSAAVDRLMEIARNRGTKQ